MKLIDDNKEVNYATILDLKTHNDNYIFVNNIDSLKEYNKVIGNKIAIANILFKIILATEIVIHSILSYYNLRECEEKIGKMTYNNYYLDKSHQKSINFVCASYLIHIFLMLGYFLIGFITIYKPNKLNFKVFEIYIITMMVTDLFFSFVNQRNLYFALEGVINLLLVKYLRFLHFELNKVNV